MKSRRQGKGKAHMGGIAAWLERINGRVNGFAWGPIMLALLVGTGIYLSIRTGFVSVRRFGFIIRHTLGTLFGKKRKTGRDNGANISPFQAVSTALAGTVGTGNIAGVTGAVFAGGPGAVFWMWVSAFFGMCTKYSEIALSIKYREKDDAGRFRGGPMYYISGGLGRGWKWLAVVFAVCGGLASFGIGNISQSSEISGAMKSLVGLRPLATGVILAATVGVVVIGGVKRIGAVTACIVPFMSVLYIICGFAVILLRITEVPAVFGKIISGAFSIRAAGGGLFGCGMAAAIRQGVARGVFSNEAGLGSAPMAHAASCAQEPAEQAMWGVVEVFIDTVVICTVTAFFVILSGVPDYEGGLGAFPSGGAAAAAAFNKVLPGKAGGTLIQISLLFFAFSTILCWSYYGQTCTAFISNNSRAAAAAYKVIFILVCVAGAAGSGTLMWDIADTLNGLMALPNLIALIALASTTAKLTRDYFTPERMAADKNRRKALRRRRKQRSPRRSAGKLYTMRRFRRGISGRQDRARGRNNPPRYHTRL